MAVGLGGAVRGLNRPSPRPCAGHVAIVSYLQGVLNIVHRTTDAKAPVTSGNTPDINKHPPPPVIPHTPACKPLLSPYEQFPPLLTLISLPLSHQWCFLRTAGGCTAPLLTPSPPPIYPCLTLSLSLVSGVFPGRRAAVLRVFGWGGVRVRRPQQLQTRHAHVQVHSH